MFFLSEKPNSSHTAGNKARLDVENIMQQRGQVLAHFVEFTEKSLVARIGYRLNFSNWMNIFRLYFTKGKDIFIQYPFRFKTFEKLAIKKAVENNNVVALVHDLDELRGQQSSHDFENRNLLNSCKVLIVHNECMRQKFSEIGIKTHMIELELFDYMLDRSIPNKKRNLGKEISYAGALSKSGFFGNSDIESLEISFNLYGPRFDESWNIASNLNYIGSFTPNEIPYKLEGSFGLIWDGDSIDTCNGPKGNYLRYNNPHKLSLYIAAGLPVIVWNKSAVADFVRKHGIGLCVDSLKDISSSIDKLSEEDYQSMLDNIAVEQKKVASGYYTNRALDELEEICFNKKVAK